MADKLPDRRSGPVQLYSKAGKQYDDQALKLAYLMLHCVRVSHSTAVQVRGFILEVVSGTGTKIVQHLSFLCKPVVSSE